MKVLFPAIVLLGLLSVAAPLVAQQDAAKPAESSTPTPDPAQTPAPPPSEPPAPSPASAIASPALATPVDSSRYVIGQDDSIQVSVWKEPTLSGTFPVRPDGMISLALVGDVAASGRTPMDLATDLTAKLKKYITDPTVTVTVLAVNSKRVFLLGEVQHIGAIPLTSAISPLQAIAAAGGLTPYANKSHIYILRGEQGKQKKIPYDYKKAIKNGDDQGVILLPGDTIVVP